MTGRQSGVCMVVDDLTDRTIVQSRAIEALETVEPSIGFERAIARLVVKACKRRLRTTIGTAPAWVGDRIFDASESTPDQGATEEENESTDTAGPLHRRIVHAQRVLRCFGPKT